MIKVGLTKLIIRPKEHEPEREIENEMAFIETNRTIEEEQVEEICQIIAPEAGEEVKVLPNLIQKGEEPENEMAYIETNRTIEEEQSGEICQTHALEKGEEVRMFPNLIRE
jgi:hypothetical protein